MGDNNSDLSNRNKTVNSHVMCFVFVSLIITLQIIFKLIIQDRAT